MWWFESHVQIIDKAVGYSSINMTGLFLNHTPFKGIFFGILSLSGCTVFAYTPGKPNENTVQNHLNIALLNVFNFSN